MSENNKNFSYELSNVLKYMVDVLGVEYPTEVYSLEYLVVAILDSKKSHANMILDNCLRSDNIAELREIYVSNIQENLKPFAKKPNPEKVYNFNDALDKVLRQSSVEAEKMQVETVGSEHVLLSMLNPSNGFKVSDVFQSMNVTYDQIMRKCEVSKPSSPKKDRKGLINGNGGVALKGNVNTVSVASNHEYISKYTANINKLVLEGHTDKLIGREAEIDQIINVFARRRKNNAILVGPAGCGKTQIVHGLAEKIISGDVPPFLSDKEIVMLDIMALVSGTNFRGMLEERVDNLFKELKKNKKYILFLDDIHVMLRSGSKEKDTDISGMITQVLVDGDVQVIAATNYKEYRNTVEINNAIQRKLQRINVEPNSREEAETVLKGTKQYYETYHNVTYSDEVIERIVKLAERYVANSTLPDSAFDVLDTTGAYVSLRESGDKKLSDMKKRLVEIDTEKTEMLNRGEFEGIEPITLEEDALKRAIDAYQAETKGSPTNVTEDDVTLVLSEMVKVPVSKLSVDDKKNIANLDVELKKVVIGQDNAIDEICKSIKRHRVGLGYKKGVQSYLAIGQSGIGKTLIVKELAKLIYGDEKAFIRLDMSEYSEKNSVSKLYGSAPGYVGFENGGQLTEAVKNKPYSIILLDEIEKADPEVYNVFLQLLDEGRLTDSSGQIVNFKNCIVVMTSNIGVKQASEMGAGIGFEVNETTNKRSIIEKELKKKFPPEFLNRIDKIVFFNNLSDDSLKRIVRLEIDKFNCRLSELKFNFKYDDSVVEYIHGLSKEQKEYGARPIVRLIQENIEDTITDLLLKGNYEPQYVFSGTCKDGKIEIS